MTFSRFLDNLRWNFMEAGLMHVHSQLRQFADGTGAGGVTLSGAASFGAVDMQTQVTPAVVPTVNDPGQFNLGVGSSNPPIDKAPPTTFRT